MILSASSPPSRWPACLPALLSALAGFVVFAAAIPGSYVYDDQAIVRDDLRLRSPGHWGGLWTHDYFNGGIDNLYRPLVSTSYAVQWWLHDDHAWMFHLVNVLLHAAVCAAVAEFTRRAMGASATARPAAVIAGLLFAVHPLHAEAVANIVGRAELACALAVLVSLIVLVRWPLTMPRVVLIVLIGVAGVLCKEQGVLQPLLWALLLAVVAPLRWPAAWRQQGRQPLRWLVLLTVWIWAAYLLGREHFLKFDWDRSQLDPTVQPLLLCQGVDRLLMPIALLGRYVQLLIWPARLSVDYGAEVIGHHTSGGDPFLWIGLASMLIGAGLLIFAWRRREGVLAFALISAALVYGMVGNIVTLIATNFAERLMYLPSAFIAMAAAVLLARCKPPLRNTVITVMIATASARTIVECWYWDHPLVMFQKELASHPQSVQLHLLLGQEYRAIGDFKDSDAVLADLTRRYPQYWRAWTSRAIGAIEAGDLNAADQYLTTAARNDPKPAILAVRAQLDAAKLALKKR